MNKIIAIVGMCGSGKSVANKFFEEKGYQVIYFGGVTMKKLKEERFDITPENEKMMREKLRKDLGMGAYAIVLLDDIKKALEKGNVVLDGVYSWSELKILEKEFPNIKVLSIVVDKIIRYERLENRVVRPFTNEQAIKRDVSEIENLEKGGPICYADYFILNNDDEDKYKLRLENIYSKIEKRN
ncbi:MAG: AAA family ATPase [Bacilli bacterium]|nr:AAA family ATPase [Bacilli bacterium]